MRTSRRRHITLLCTAALLAGCGGQARRTSPPRPKLPARLAEQLATRSDAVAAKLDANDSCGALAEARRLQRQTIAAINRGLVPTSLQEPLSSAANDLTSRITCTPPPPPADEQHHDNGKGMDHGKHDGEGD
jgi:hypothetical protein